MAKTSEPVDNDERILSIKLPKEFDDERLIREYCSEAGIDSWAVRSAVGQIEAASRMIDGDSGPEKVRWISLIYFFAGLRFARKYGPTAYQYKKLKYKAACEEKKKVEEEKDQYGLCG